MGESSLVVKDHLSGPYRGTEVKAYITYSQIEIICCTAIAVAVCACFNIRLYFHGLSPLSMS